jgi:hypothetical protein
MYERKVLMKKRKIVLSMFLSLSIFTLGGHGVQAETNIPPTVYAGIDIAISVNDVATTMIYGSVTDPDNSGFLKCAWENNLQQLTPLMEVLNGICPLELSTLNNPTAGIYTLILYGLDGSVVASDSMLLTLVDSNSGPIANAGPDITITTDQIATTTLQGTIVNPYNNDPLRCAWYENGITQATVIFDVVNGECPLDLSNSQIDFDTGSYTLVLYGIDDSVIYSDSMILTIIPPINTPATVEAGPDMVITSDDIATTTIFGSITDPDNTGFLKCAWEDQNFNQLTPLMDVVNNVCPLNLSTTISSSFEVGEYVLTLYGLDGSFISSDSMTLTIVSPNIAPVADAGINISITTEQIAATVIQGTATDADGDLLNCRWTDGVTELLNTSIGTSGICNLNLSSLSIGVGTYSLFLEISDGDKTSADEMILTIDNSSPNAAPGGGGVYEINTDVILVGDASDFDGDSLNYDWTEGTTEGLNTICSGTVQAVAGGDSIILPDCVVSNLSLGLHTLTLRVDDGLNLPNSKNVSVEIVDTTVPTLAPVAIKYLLWPPNHNLVNISIQANASDNSGLLPALSAAVVSNEPENGLGDGDIDDDWTEPIIDQINGTISLQLRSERSGSGNGRVYTVSITATDSSNNSSIAIIDIIVPHDKRKK